MLRIYNKLVWGETTAEAVAAGRQQLISDPERFARFARFEHFVLFDWIIPLLYEQKDFVLVNPVSKIARSSCGLGSDSALESNLLVGMPAAGAFPFVGREIEMFPLERKFLHSNVVLLRGVKGA